MKKRTLILKKFFTILLFIICLQPSVNAQVTLNLKLFIEGMYTGGGLMDNNGAGGCLFVTGESANPLDADRVLIAAMDPFSPFNLVDEQEGILKTDGNVSVTFDPSVIDGLPYYIRVRHRNSIETWSALPVTLNTVTTYLFSASASQAYYNNQVLLPDNLHYAIYSGDFNQDGVVDAGDFLELDPSIQYGDGGYAVNDLNGDGAVDGLDFPVYYCNVTLGISAAFP